MHICAIGAQNYSTFFYRNYNGSAKKTPSKRIRLCSSKEKKEYAKERRRLIAEARARLAFREYQADRELEEEEPEVVEMDVETTEEEATDDGGGEGDQSLSSAKVSKSTILNSFCLWYFYLTLSKYIIFVFALLQPLTLSEKIIAECSKLSDRPNLNLNICSDDDETPPPPPSPYRKVLVSPGSTLPTPFFKVQTEEEAYGSQFESGCLKEHICLIKKLLTVLHISMILIAIM